jgi:hypothetical protein
LEAKYIPGIEAQCWKLACLSILAHQGIGGGCKEGNCQEL